MAASGSVVRVAGFGQRFGRPLGDGEPEAGRDAAGGEAGRVDEAVEQRSLRAAGPEARPTALEDDAERAGDRMLGHGGDVSRRGTPHFQGPIPLDRRPHAEPSEELRRGHDSPVFHRSARPACRLDGAEHRLGRHHRLLIAQFACLRECGRLPLLAVRLSPLVEAGERHGRVSVSGHRATQFQRHGKPVLGYASLKAPLGNAMSRRA